MTNPWQCWRDASHDQIITTEFGWPQCSTCWAAPAYHERPDYVPAHFVLGIYVPDPTNWRAAATVEPRSGIVGLPTGVGGEYISVYYEGWVNGPMQYAERDARGLWEAGIQHAAGRMVVDYPTIARAHLPSNSLTRIGIYRPKSGEIELTDEARLNEWLEPAHA